MQSWSRFCSPEGKRLLNLFQLGKGSTRTTPAHPPRCEAADRPKFCFPTNICRCVFLPHPFLPPSEVIFPAFGEPARGQQLQEPDNPWGAGRLCYRGASCVGLALQCSANVPAICNQPCLSHFDICSLRALLQSLPTGMFSTQRCSSMCFRQEF